MAGVVSASSIDKLWPASVLSSNEASLSKLLWDDERLRLAARRQTAKSLADDAKSTIVADLSEYAVFKFGLDTHAHIQHNCRLRHCQLERDRIDAIIERCDEYSNTDTGGQHLTAVTGLTTNGPAELVSNHRFGGGNRRDLRAHSVLGTEGDLTPHCDNQDRSLQGRFGDNSLDKHRLLSPKRPSLLQQGDVLDLVSPDLVHLNLYNEAGTTNIVLVMVLALESPTITHFVITYTSFQVSIHPDKRVG